jgi:hypothetical protein
MRRMLFGLLSLVACGGYGGVRVEGPVAAETTFTGWRGRYRQYLVRLDAAGIAASGRLLRPAGDGPFAAVLLNDGRELDSRALEHLPPEFGDVVVLSLDYPEDVPAAFTPLPMLLGWSGIERALRRIPPLFSLGAAYLTSRTDVDDARVAMVVTSFAVPFGVKAAAADPRFRNVALVYGAGRLGDVVAANLDLGSPFAALAGWLARQQLDEFEPTRFVEDIAPRPLVMVNGVDDPQMPVPAVAALYEAAREPKRIVWLRTGHLMPTDSALIRRLVDTTLASLPVLERIRARPAASDATR